MREVVLCFLLGGLPLNPNHSWSVISTNELKQTALLPVLTFTPPLPPQLMPHSLCL